MVHRRQTDPLAVLARQRVIEHQEQGLVRRYPGERQSEQHAAQGVQAPRRAREEAVKDRDVAVLGGPRRHRDGGGGGPGRGGGAPRPQALGGGGGGGGGRTVGRRAHHGKRGRG